MDGLNENHKRRVLVTFQALDEMFGRAEQIIAAAQSGSPFREYAADVTPKQHELIADCARQVRSAMVRTLPRLNIAVPSPGISAAWAVYMELAMMSGETVEELRPRHMRGYGPVPAEAAAELDACVTELQTILDRLAGSFHRGPDQPPREAIS